MSQIRLKNSTSAAASSDDSGLLSEFEKKIQEQENLLYGMALFFECISLLYADDKAILETYRKQFRNVIKTGKEMNKQATEALQQARQDPDKLEQVQQFQFTPGSGHPRPQELVERAQALLNAYESSFPGRSRSQAFTEDEVLRLMDSASVSF